METPSAPTLHPERPGWHPTAPAPTPATTPATPPVADPWGRPSPPDAWQPTTPPWPASPPVTGAVPPGTLPPPPNVFPPAPVPTPAPRERRDLPIANILLGVGSGLVVVAALVFVGVNWSRMGASLQGVFLLALTVVAAAITGLAARRDMPATAEALGLVAASLLLADAHAVHLGVVPGMSDAAFWSLGLLAVAALSWLFADAVGIRSPRFVAVIIGQGAVLPASWLLDPDSGIAAAALQIAQVGLVVAWCARAVRIPKAERVVAAVVAALVGAFGVALVSAAWFDLADTDRDTVAARLGVAAVYLLATAVVAEVAVWLRRNDGVRIIALAVASGLGLAASAAIADALVPDAWFAVAVGAVAVAVMAVSARVDRRWGQTPAVTGGLVGLACVAPLANALGACLGAMGDASIRPWDLAAATRADGFLPEGAQVDGRGVLVALLAIAAAAGLALAPLLTRSIVRVWLAVTWLIALVVVPVLLPVSIAGAAAAAAAGMLLLAGWALLEVEAGRSPVPATLGALAAASVAASWAVASRPVTLGVLAVGTASAALVWLAGRRGDRDVLALGGAAITSLGLAGTAAVTALTLDADSAAAALAASAVTGLLALAGGLLVERRDGGGHGLAAGDRGAMWALEVVAVGAHVLAIDVAISDPAAVSRALAVGVVLSAIAALRPARRWLFAVTAGEALALTWMQLADHGVRLPEAYGLPAALVLLGAGMAAERMAAERDEELGSWITLGPALLAALGPTVWMAVIEGGTVRPLVGVAAGGALLVIGAFTGRRAPVDVGVAAIAVLAVTRLAPAVADLPNWVTLGVTGLILVAIGARFEAVRRDIDQVHKRYRDLR